MITMRDGTQIDFAEGIRLARIYSAAETLIEAGICLSVPGWLHLDTPLEAVEYARDPVGFYAEHQGISRDYLETYLRDGDPDGHPRGWPKREITAWLDEAHISQGGGYPIELVALSCGHLALTKRFKRQRRAACHECAPDIAPERTPTFEGICAA